MPLNTKLSAVYRTVAAFLAAPATRIRAAILRRNAVTNAHVADESLRARRRTAARRPELTAAQLDAVGTRARIVGDLELAAAATIAQYSWAAMATCVAAQDANDRAVEVGRLVHARADALQIEARREYEPWVPSTVEVVP